MAQHPQTPLAVPTITLRATIQPTHMLAPLDRPRSTSYLSGPEVLDLTEWDLILQTGSNALLEGDPLALNRAVSALEPHLRAPHYMASGPRWSRPSAAVGTLFLEHVAECSSEQQHVLLDWFDGAAGSVQVITTTERPLFDLVECGVFLSALYYRLNTVHLKLDAAL